MNRQPADRPSSEAEPRRHVRAAAAKRRSEKKPGKPTVKPGKRPGRKKKASATPTPPQRRPANPKPFW